MTVRRAHSENRVASLEGRSVLMSQWGVLALVPWRSIFRLIISSVTVQRLFPGYVTII